ncbi:SDR family oxidoreductase [Salisediminibacterium selenitireducens]|uniref:Short-chain dehydrogenase/reductase SDR n=1 Tax=Bacillus selenitireducens (strain ATCC 700615 / DSM 15326 / MLS10) TaxID=439292 RepID=D6XZ23_BACIE|nr:SDR family oxidoreductase [Salisediminibacterium selenitireducens]ADI00308.1 short-chain dehydrogenase/reductase SDR [[Bacillus] selenitireducens MLS10]
MRDDIYRDPLPLKGRRYIITGVSRRIGIGAAIARQIAAWGGSVILHHYGTHDEEQPWGGDDIDAVKKDIRGYLTENATLHDSFGDLQDPSEPDRFFDTILSLGVHVDGIILNHALSGSDGAIGDLTAEMLDRHYAINTRATMLLIQHYVRHFGQSGNGRVVMMTSGQGMGPMPGEVAYSLSKGALAGITLTLSDQLSRQGITVNTVNPGPVDTGYLSEEDWQTVRRKFPFGRFGEPKDPARLIAWLVTDEAHWITGQVIHSEGGFARWRD